MCGTVSGQQRELCNLETRLLELQRKINRLMCTDTVCNDVLQLNRVEARNLWNKIKALLIRRYPQSMPSYWLSRALPNIHDITCMLTWVRTSLKQQAIKVGKINKIQTMQRMGLKNKQHLIYKTVKGSWLPPVTTVLLPDGTLSSRNKDLHQEFRRTWNDIHCIHRAKSKGRGPVQLQDPWCDMAVDYLLTCMGKKPLSLRADEGLSMEKGRCPKIRP